MWYIVSKLGQALATPFSLICLDLSWHTRYPFLEGGLGEMGSEEKFMYQ